MRNWILLCVLCVCSSSLVLAEYHAVLKFPTPEAGFDAAGKPLEVMAQGVDAIDINACEAIAENIRVMERYRVPWECEFPISSSIYLLSKPKWVELFGRERRDALGLRKPYDPAASDGDIKVFYSFYDEEAKDPKGKVFSAYYPAERCEKGGGPIRGGVWFLWDSGLPQISGEHVVVYSGRLYFVSYVASGYTTDRASVADRSFFLTKIKNRRPGSMTKVVGEVCSVIP